MSSLGVCSSLASSSALRLAEFDVAVREAEVEEEEEDKEENGIEAPLL